MWTAGFYSPEWWKKRDPKNPHDCSADQLYEAIQGYFTADALPRSLSTTPGISGKVGSAYAYTDQRDTFTLLRSAAAVNRKKTHPPPKLYRREDNEGTVLTAIKTQTFRRLPQDNRSLTPPTKIVVRELRREPREKVSITLCLRNCTLTFAAHYVDISAYIVSK